MTFEDGIEFDVDQRVLEDLEGIKKEVIGHDEDAVFIVDGGEGEGKSVLAQQLAKTLDPNFSLDQIYFNGEAFKEGIDRARHASAHIFDESHEGLSSRSSLSKDNITLVSKIMTCRQKNLFIFLVIPSFFMLDRYAALFRSKVLFHVYKDNRQKGHYVVFNQKNKKLCYIHGKKFMTYGFPRTNYFARFSNTYTVDEKEYRHRKMRAMESLGTKMQSGIKDKFYERDICVSLLAEIYKNIGKNQIILAKDLTERGYEIKQNRISQICQEVKAKDPIKQLKEADVS